MVGVEHHDERKGVLAQARTYDVPEYTYVLLRIHWLLLIVTITSI